MDKNFIIYRVFEVKQYADDLFSKGDIFFSRPSLFRQGSFDPQRHDPNDGFIEKEFKIPKAFVNDPIELYDDFYQESILKIDNITDMIISVREEESREKIIPGDISEDGITISLKMDSNKFTYSSVSADNTIFDDYKYFEAISKLGDYTVVITDTKEFLRRIHSKYKNYINGLYWGKIEYVNDKCCEDHDEFKKFDPNQFYKYQNEFKIVLYMKSINGKTISNKLSIGNISDIAFKVYTKDLIKRLHLEKLKMIKVIE